MAQISELLIDIYKLVQLRNYVNELSKQKAPSSTSQTPITTSGTSETASISSYTVAKSEETLDANVGLHNYGNTCFINSTLQLLYHMTDLRNFLIQDVVCKQYNKNTISRVIINLLHKISTRQIHSLDALPFPDQNDIRKICNIIKLEFGQQQDASEFLLNVLRSLLIQCDKVSTNTLNIEKEKICDNKGELVGMIPKCMFPIDDPRNFFKINVWAEPIHDAIFYTLYSDENKSLREIIKDPKNNEYPCITHKYIIFMLRLFVYVGRAKLLGKLKKRIKDITGLSIEAIEGRVNELAPRCPEFVEPMFRYNEVKERKDKKQQYQYKLQIKREHIDDTLEMPHYMQLHQSQTYNLVGYIAHKGETTEHGHYVYYDHFTKKFLDDNKQVDNLPDVTPYIIVYKINTKPDVIGEINPNLGKYLRSLDDKNSCVP